MTTISTSFQTCSWLFLGQIFSEARETTKAKKRSVFTRSKPWPWPHSVRHPWPRSTPRCRPQSSHTYLKGVRLRGSCEKFLQWNIGTSPAWEEVFFKQPSLKNSCKDLLLRHAVEKGDKKHQTGTSGLSAPMTAHKDFQHHINYYILQNLENWVFGVAAGVAADVSGPKSHSTHHHPLKSSHLRSKLFFFCRKNRPFLNLDGELGEGWRNVARPEPSRVPAQNTHQILRWDWPE